MESNRKQAQYKNKEWENSESGCLQILWLNKKCLCYMTVVPGGLDG